MVFRMSAKRKSVPHSELGLIRHRCSSSPDPHACCPIAAASYYEDRIPGLGGELLADRLALRRSPFALIYRVHSRRCGLSPLHIGAGGLDIGGSERDVPG